MTNKLLVENDYYVGGYEDIHSYCRWLNNKNIVALHLLENYLGITMDSNDKLVEIKKIILDVSGSINRLPYTIVVKENDNEKF